MKDNGNTKIRYVTLIATEDCNLCCSYCYENHKTAKCFDVDTTIKIIEDELNKEDEFDEISFEFFGGEPFLAFDRIKEIVNHFRGKLYKKRFGFFAGTNGTLFSEEVKQWLLANKDCFQLGLSLDGTKKMHDTNRSNSFDLIDLEFVLNEFKNVVVKMTVSQETLADLCDGVKFCHEIGFQNISCNLAQGIDWSRPDNKALLEREMNKLIEYYLNNPQLTPCSLFDYQIRAIAYRKNIKTIPKFCGVGTRMKVYDINGIEYPCQYFLPLSIGTNHKSSAEITFKNEFDISDLETKCQSCIAVAICPSCYGANYSSTGNIHRRDPLFCELTKIIVRANAFFKAKQWQLGRLELNEFEEQELLKGILAVQEELK